MHAALLWHILPAVSGVLPAWPGDTRFEARATCATCATGPCCQAHVSSMSMSTHLGATVGARFHDMDASPARAILCTLAPPASSQSA